MSSPHSIPPWMVVAQELLGTKEVPGSSNNAKIMAWAKIIGGNIEDSYVADSIPWCGLFAAFCVVQVGIDPVKDPLWALNWRIFGEKQQKPCFGSILTMTRQGGGHVGFVVSQDATHWHLLAGNQSDEVNVTRISKEIAVKFNFPKGFDEFKKPLPFKKFDGKSTTTLKFD